MLVQEIMIKRVITVGPQETVAQAAARMRDEQIGCLVVMEAGAIVGIVTDRDLLGCMHAGHETKTCLLANHMSKPVFTTEPRRDLLSVATEMASRKIKRVPVVSAGKLVGLLSFSDIAQLMNEQLANIWSEWIQVAAITKAQAEHRRGKKLSE